MSDRLYLYREESKKFPIPLIFCVAEVFGALLAADVRSYSRRGWNPDGGVFRAEDLLREAGVL